MRVPAEAPARHKKGVAEAKVQTVDAGAVTVFYVVQPDVQGNWGIDVGLDRRPSHTK